MQVVLDDDCLLHDPPYETLSGFRVPYFESPARYRAIKAALACPDNQTSFIFIKADPTIEIESYILRVHPADYIGYMERAYTDWVTDGGNKDGVVPDTFLHQRLLSTANISTLKPIAKAGYYCFDLSTPITADTFKSTTAAARVALTAARQLTIGGEKPAETKPFGVFALTRPPGHHAGQSLCGGYCYFNNAAIAARFLQSQPHPLAAAAPTIAILDIDYHHGNGSKSFIDPPIPMTEQAADVAQEIFYEDPGVFYVSIHAAQDYPYFTGFPEEKGSGKGLGYNLNIALPRGTTGDVEYCNALLEAISKIREYDPTYLLISLGVDTFENDPISDFKLTKKGYSQIGKAISTVLKPTLFIMEGGYDLPTIGDNVKAVLEGFQTVSDNPI